MEFLQEYWPFLIPIILIDLGLKLFAVLHIIKHNSFRFGNRIIWLIISIALNLIGPVLYFTIGKGDE